MNRSLTVPHSSQNEVSVAFIGEGHWHGQFALTILQVATQAMTVHLLAASAYLSAL